MKKRALLVCKETFGIPFYFLGKKLEKEGYEIAFYFVHHTECFEDKNPFNKYTYYFFKDKLKSNKIYDVIEITESFIKNCKNPNLDNDYLREIEKKYTHYKCMNKQIISSQLLSTAYHFRWFWKDLNHEQTLYWLQLNYGNTESVFHEFSPDVVFDLDTSEFQRTIVNEVSYCKNIPYISIEYSRYGSWILPTYNLGLQMEAFFQNRFKRNLGCELDLECKILSDYKSQDKIMPEKFKNESTSKFQYSYIDGLKRILLTMYVVIKTDILSSNLLKKNLKINLPLFSNPIKSLLWRLLTETKKAFLSSRFNKYFEKPGKNEFYVYMPLHVIPESTTFVKSPLFIDELFLIQSIAKSLPVKWKLYVKEHPAMLGERPLSFYKEVRRLYNVKLVKLDYYNDPKPWINNSKGVITISGTTALEAVMLEKPAAIFAHVAFNVINSVFFVNKIENLSSIFQKFDNFEINKENVRSCAAYIKTVMDLGSEIDIQHVIRMASRKIVHNDLSDNDEALFNKYISVLFHFYSTALKKYNVHNKKI